MQDVRGKNSQSTFDLGGQPSKIITGIHRYNSFDNNKQLIAVNVRFMNGITFSTDPCPHFLCQRKEIDFHLHATNIV